MPTIIIAEKPDAAQHISEALAEKNLRKKSSNEGVPWWEFERDGKKFITVAAVGHLFGLKQKKGVRDYPIFDVEWVPNFSANKKAFFSKKYFAKRKGVQKIWLRKKLRRKLQRKLPKRKLQKRKKRDSL